MIVRRTRWSDVRTVNSWLAMRSLPGVPAEVLPPTGFIVDALAVVWLYPMAGVPMGMLEHLVANPEASKLERDVAVDKVVFAALDEAKRLGLRYVVSVTSMPAVAERAQQKHGFKVQREDATLLVADVGGR